MFTKEKAIRVLGSNHKEIVLNSAYFLFLVSLVGRLIASFFETSPYSSYEYWNASDFLINYQSGFVRRGLTGEILLFFAQNFNINVGLTIKTFCLICLVAVCAFFVKAFLKKGYSLYILPLCFFLGSGFFSAIWIRKDYMFFVFFITIFWLYESNLRTITKALLINVLAAFIILCHEAFAFFSLPILFLLFFNEHRNRGLLNSFVLSSLYAAPSIFVFLLVLLMHGGNQETAQTIWNSWVNVINVDASDIGLSVQAIGWTKEHAVNFHIGVNFLTIDNKISPIIGWGIVFPAVYYIASNALLAFRKEEYVFTDRDKTTLSSLLVFQFLCLLPMFLALSCDYIRISFYWIASSFALFLLVPRNKIESLFPKRFVNSVERINKFSTNILQPSKTNLAFLMLLVGVPTAGFATQNVFDTSMLRNILGVLSAPLIPISNFLLPLFGG
jgi:hypothetical protein